MKLVKQEDPFGCSIACVASLLKINYRESLSLFENGKMKAEANGFLCKGIIAALESKNLKLKYRYLNSKIKIKLETIVFIKRCKRYPAGHYLLKTESGWMDPWINFPNANIKAGFRKRLPGKAIYAIFQMII